MTQRLFAFHVITRNNNVSLSLLQKSLLCTYQESSLSPNSSSQKCDVAIIGGGIIGASIARKLKLAHNELQVILLEKENALAKHQSSHNSGVIHSGIYYKPHSFKARFCVKGADILKKYCDEKNIGYNKCGKLIVAKNCEEVSVLEELFQRGIKNRVQNLVILKSQCEIMKIAPGCRGLQALWCPETANVDFKEVTRHFGEDFKNAGGTVLLNRKVINLTSTDDSYYPLSIVEEEFPPIKTKYVIACGGLQSETLTKIINPDSLCTQTFISLKVDYHKIQSKYCDCLETNIYPVPDLSVPFLGAHLSPQLDGTVLLGPYAVPALKMEGYSNDEINLTYLSTIATSCGFRNMIIRNFSKCLCQATRAVYYDAQIKHLQELMPNFSYQFAEKGPTAVQCQLVNNDGTFFDDFAFEFFEGEQVGQRVINVKFTPSPAATSSLAIADYVVEELNKKLC